MGSCHYCRTAISAEVLRRHRLCPRCGSDLHCCRNCEHFAPALAAKCREPESPWVGDRQSENDCSYFEFRRPTAESPPGPEADADPAAEKAKQAFAALFRNRSAGES
jgi:hypothetical protein